MESRYIIVHLIRGEAKNAHEEITRKLAEHLDGFPIHESIVPHLTLKRWFELDEIDIQKVQDLLDEFARSHKQSAYHLYGLNNFGEGVIYVDVKASNEMLETVSDLMRSLRSIKKMTFDEYDAFEGDFHATVAMRALKLFDFSATWEYLQTLEKMDFNMVFDNIAILKKENNKWVPERIWELVVN